MRLIMGKEGMSAGPGLMFISLPKIFASMKAGSVIGSIFFLMVIFAALTSSISLLEAVVSSFCDRLKWNRKKSIIVASLLSVFVGLIVCLGYNVFYFDLTLPNGSVGQILDVLDYLSNNVLMPVLALLTCIFIGWIAGPDVIIGEVEKNGEKFLRKKIYTVIVKYVAPVCLFILLLQAIGII